MIPPSSVRFLPEGKKPKTVLWISRHSLTPEQTAELERFCAGPFRLIHRTETIGDIGTLADDIAHADVLAAVLPPHLLAQLVSAAAGKPVLMEQSQRRLVPNAAGEPSVIFTHGGWLRIRQMVLETEPAVPAFH